MKRRIITVLVVIAATFGLSSVARAGCPASSIMVAGGAPGYPSVCLSIEILRGFLN